MDIAYRYSQPLAADQLRALAALSDVYGIRALKVDEDARRIGIEYDATRLDAAGVIALVRGCGVAATE
ncbi:MAG: hypothetical protein ACRD1E_08880 [Terriglobales bacterium]